MENQITCPNCKKTISHNPIIDEAAEGVVSDTQSIVCACGEQITYWRIIALLRDQMCTVSLHNWFCSFSKG
jgi:hypothetical protein